MQFRDFTTTDLDGVMIGNPPYGERIGEKEVIEEMIRDMGRVLDKHPTWSVYMLSSMANFESLYGQKATKKRKLFNGFIRNRLLSISGAEKASRIVTNNRVKIAAKTDSDPFRFHLSFERGFI